MVLPTHPFLDDGDSGIWDRSEAVDGDVVFGRDVLVSPPVLCRIYLMC